MALPPQDASTGDNGATKIAACELSPLVIPGKVSSFPSPARILVLRILQQARTSSSVSRLVERTLLLRADMACSGTRYKVLDQLQVSSDSRRSDFTL
jgi:hypothetical protein